MTIHDQAKVSGVSEACKYNDHSDCRAPGCGCDCHRKVLVEATAGDLIPKGPEKACPKCGARRPFNETFCRIDGERLASLLCAVCGAGMEPEDNFCWRCSSPKGVAKTPDINAPIPISPISPISPDKEVDYAEVVLKGLQNEMAASSTNSEPEDESQRVIEQPAGTQGSFKIVSRANPNKVRGPSLQGGPAGGSKQALPPSPASAGVSPSVVRVRLPIKP